MTKSIAILGAGPAGMSAALWLKQLGLHPIVIEQKAISGGMLRYNFLHNNWVLGQIDQSGLDLAERFQQHIRQEEITLIENATVTAIEHSKQEDSHYSIHLNTQTRIACYALFIATGTRYRGYEVLEKISGLEDLTPQHSRLGPHCFVELSALKDRTIAIIGAGDNALENACLLLEQGCTVHIIARKQVRAQQQFLDMANSHPQCYIHCYTTITNITLIKHYIELQISTQTTNPQSTNNHCISVDRLHILAGYVPNSGDILEKLHIATGLRLNTDSMGYIQTDETQRTNIPYVYAIGDIADSLFPSVVNALSAGARAAKHLSLTI